MKRCLLIVVISYAILLTGCNQNEKVTFNDEVVQKELEEANTKKIELKKNLDDARNTIVELEKQVDDLKAEVNRLSNQEGVKQELNGINELKIIKVDENVIKFLINESKIPAQSVSIVGNNIDGFIEEYEEIHLGSPSDFNEYFKATVIGSIYNLQLIELEWNNETNDLEEVNVAYEMEEVRNQTVYITTILPCGLPGQKIKWENSKGDSHEIYLSNDGYGFDGSIVLSE
ncbi:hypothetical protein [Vallitalea okinawensis]|uniref:hypothetical protein n=1 Tax=Vallitalea okinawensis TaxID=2078660 RepID=UPI0013005AE8|nr:hypothetical protein [Vallitalea okinawensis]